MNVWLFSIGLIQKGSTAIGHVSDNRFIIKHLTSSTQIFRKCGSFKCKDLTTNTKLFVVINNKLERNALIHFLNVINS